jgi:hypothetical protein
MSSPHNSAEHAGHSKGVKDLEQGTLQGSVGGKDRDNDLEKSSSTSVDDTVTDKVKNKWYVLGLSVQF